MLLESDLNDQKIIDNYNTELSQVCQLSFSPNDIKYIIISDESERLGIFDDIKNIKSPKGYTPEMIKILQSKIITMKQIIKDF